MKKLDKYQVKALASKIVSKGREERNKEEDKLRKDKKLAKRVDEIYKIIEKIPAPVRRKFYLLDNSMRDTKQTILNALLDTSSLPKLKSQSTVEDEIIIASIDAEDMDSIVKAINCFE